MRAIPTDLAKGVIGVPTLPTASHWPYNAHCKSGLRCPEIRLSENSRDIPSTEMTPHIGRRVHTWRLSVIPRARADRHLATVDDFVAAAS